MDDVFTFITHISFCSNGMVNLSHNFLQTRTSKKRGTKPNKGNQNKYQDGSIMFEIILLDRQSKRSLSQ